jgi:hypothetical protein
MAPHGSFHDLSRNVNIGVLNGLVGEEAAKR